jgi:hypothetical protein
MNQKISRRSILHQFQVETRRSVVFDKTQGAFDSQLWNGTDNFLPNEERPGFFRIPALQSCSPR